jgi:hypothetical protein
LLPWICDARLVEVWVLNDLTVNGYQEYLKRVSSHC